MRHTLFAAIAAASLMVASALVPMWYFYKRGWLT